MGYYAALVAPAVFGLIAWDLMCEKASKELLLAGFLLSGLCGLLSAAYFWTPSGMEPAGFAVALPFMGFICVVAARIYYLESRTP